MKRNLFSVIVLLSLLASCTTKTPSKERPCTVIDLAKNIDGAANDIALNDIFELKRVIPLPTSDSFLLERHMRFIEVNDKEFVLSGEQSVYYINKENGKPRLVLNKKGNGPGEYNSIWSTVLDNQKNTLIFDSNTNRLLKYSPDGDYIENIHNDTIGTTAVFNNDFYAVLHPPYSKAKYAMSIYDKSWNLQRRGFLRDKNNRMRAYDSFLKKDGECYLIRPFFDTIYHITPKMDKPYIVTNIGKYKMPAEIKMNRQKRMTERSNYIMSTTINWIGNYMLVSYMYNDKRYSDTWDIEKEQLKYRTIFSFKEKTGFEGHPFLIDGVKISINSYLIYVLGDYLYCVIPAHDAMEFMPSVSEEDNPVILELKLK